MPRFARVVVPDCVHHVTQRGNARRDVFYSVGDRRVYLGLLKQYSEHYGLRILGYCLMTNHVHLVAAPPDAEALARTLREVHGRYARYRNAIDRSSGHVWQNRYYSCPVEEVGLGAVLRYVEQNPVRAGMVRAAEDYFWSSAAAHLGAVDPAGLVDLAPWRAGGWSPEEWAEVLRRKEDNSTVIREATYSGRPFGSEGFITLVEDHLGRRVARGKPGRPRSAARGAEM